MADLIRLSLFGTLPGGEEWSVNPVYKITSGAVITATEATAAVDAVNGTNALTEVTAVMSTTTFITGCRIEARKATGELETMAEGLRSSPQQGGGGGRLPYQSAMVASLRSLAVGGRGRGRLYWPATGLTLDSATLRINPTVRNAFCLGMKTYLKNLGDAIDGVIDETVALGVWSRTGATVGLVTKILAGDVVDTQRRRRDAIPESYAEQLYP